MKVANRNCKTTTKYLRSKKKSVGGSFIIWRERGITLYFVVYCEILEFNSD